MAGQPKTQPAEQPANGDMDQIMNELEQLEKEIGASSLSAGSDKPALKVVPDAGAPDDEEGLKEFRGSGAEPSMEDMLEDLKEDESAGGSGLLGDAEPESDVEADFDTHSENETSMQKSKEDGCLTLKLTGEVRLELQYEAEGQIVTVGFADQCLTVCLADGTEFKIPVSRGGKRSKAA